ncbi:hypothetical protein STAS_08351, partial [Striga asiatica]
MCVRVLYDLKADRLSFVPDDCLKDTGKILGGPVKSLCYSLKSILHVTSIVSTSIEKDFVSLIEKIHLLKGAKRIAVIGAAFRIRFDIMTSQMENLESDDSHSDEDVVAKTRSRTVVMKKVIRARNKGIKFKENLAQGLSDEDAERNVHLDILSQAINAKEYPGRVRGIGFGVSRKDCFPPKKRVKHDEVQSLKNNLNAVVARLEEMEKKIYGSNAKEAQPDLSDFEGNENGAPSCSDNIHKIPKNPKSIGKQTEKTKNVVTLDKSREKNAIHNAVDAEDKQSSNTEPDIIPEGFSECNVYLSSPTYRAVGRGKVHNRLGETIHTRPLPIDHVKVSLEVAFEPNALLPVPVDDEELITVRDAIGTFVAWPKNLVFVNKSISENPQNKGTKNSNVPKRNGEEKHTKGSNEVGTARNGSYCSYLTMHVQLLMRPGDLLPSIMMAKEIFGVSFEEKLGVDEINHVVMHQWIGVSAVCTYISVLRVFRAQVGMVLKKSKHLRWKNIKKTKNKADAIVPNLFLLSLSLFLRINSNLVET